MNQKINIEEAKLRLKDHGLKITHQRLVIYQALCETVSHPTAENVYAGLKNEFPSLSLGTVYKTLDVFSQAGLIKKLKGVDDSSHYDADLKSHNHLLCTKTKKIIDYKDQELVQIIENYFSLKNISNFQVKEIRLNIIGETLN